MRVLVLDNQKKPLMPCSNARARQLLREGKAAVFRRYPFTIILKDRAGGDTQPLSLNVDPGSKTTGMALVAEYKRGRCAVWALHIGHRGQQIKSALDGRLGITTAKAGSVVNGFKTGDMVAVTVPTGKKQGVYVGRVAVRSSGFFNIQTKTGVVQGISHKHCRIIQRSDGYNFNYGAAIPPTTDPKNSVAVSLPNK